MRQAVRQFVDLVRASADVAGSRMWDVLTNAATVIAGQGLSLLELLRFLQFPDYRAGLLTQARGTRAFAQYEEAHRYFAWEFAALSKNEQASYTAPVLNKIRALVDIPYLKALLCARHDTLDLPGLWQRPRLIAVHLDTWALGQDGVRLLSGLLAHSLFQTAQRHSGPVPVCLCLDEMGMQERFLGGAIRDILAMARSYNLRLLAACQHLDQLSDELRAALLANTALRVFFRLGSDDARRVAASFATGLGSQPARVSLSLSSRSQAAGPEMEALSHAIVDPENRPLCLSPVAWNELSRIQAVTPQGPREELRRLSALTTLMRLSWIPRLSVRVPDSDQAYEIGAYLSGLPGSDYHFTGPAPLRLVIRFPLPKLTVLDSKGEEERARDLARALTELPVQQAIGPAPTRETRPACASSPWPFPRICPTPTAFSATGRANRRSRPPTCGAARRSSASRAGRRRLLCRRNSGRSAPAPARRAASSASGSKGRRPAEPRLQEPYEDHEDNPPRRFPDAPQGIQEQQRPPGQERPPQESERDAPIINPSIWDTPLPPEPEVADDGSL